MQTVPCSPFSPSTDIKILLPKERNHHRAVRKLPSRKCCQRLLRGLWLLILDVDLSDAVALSAAAGGPRHLDVEEGAVFQALFFDILEDLCSAVWISII